MHIEVYCRGVFKAPLTPPSAPACVVWSWRLNLGALHPLRQLRADYIGHLVLFLPDGYAMLMRPNRAETAVHDCHCPDHVAVRVR